MYSSILIVRLSAIGDIVFSSVLISALKDKYPKAKIYWLTQPEFRSLLANNRDLDGVLTAPLKNWSDNLRTGKVVVFFRDLISLRNQLKQLKIDLCIDVQGLLKSGILARLSGAKTRIGLGSKEGSGILMTEVVPIPENNGMIGSEYRELIRHLGIKNTVFRMSIIPSSRDKRQAADYISNNSLEKGYVVICPYTTRPQKHWFDDYWVALVKLINNQLTWPIVILGGPDDRERAQALEDSCGQTVHNLVGQTTIIGAAAYIQSARALVGVDTGLTHMGTAYEIPTVALFGSTCPYLRADARTTAVIYKDLPCSPCRRKPTCNAQYMCMREIRPSEVMEKLTKVCTDS